MRIAGVLALRRGRGRGGSDRFGAMGVVRAGPGWVRLWRGFECVEVALSGAARSRRSVMKRLGVGRATGSSLPRRRDGGKCLPGLKIRGGGGSPIFFGDAGRIFLYHGRAGGIDRRGGPGWRRRAQAGVVVHALPPLLVQTRPAHSCAPVEPVTATSMAAEGSWKIGGLISPAMRWKPALRNVGVPDVPFFASMKTIARPCQGDFVVSSIPMRQVPQTHRLRRKN